MTICQRRISPFGKVCCGRSESTFLSTVGGKNPKIKTRLTKSVLVLIPLKAHDSDRTTAEKTRRMNPPRRVVQSSRATAARGVYSLFHDRGKHSAREGKKNTKTIPSLCFMFPQVSTTCLRRQSSVSTAVCLFCLVTGGFGNWKWDFGFNQESEWGGAVLGDETAVAKAGCNTSSHCGGWLEGFARTRRPAFLCVSEENAFYLLIYIIDLIDVVGRGACRTRGALKVDLTVSFLSNMVALDWSIMWPDRTILKARFLLICATAFEQVENSLSISPSVLLNHLWTLKAKSCNQLLLFKFYNEKHVKSNFWKLECRYCLLHYCKMNQAITQSHINWCYRSGLKFNKALKLQNILKTEQIVPQKAYIQRDINTVEISAIHMLKAGSCYIYFGVCHLQVREEAKLYSPKSQKMGQQSSTSTYVNSYLTRQK